MERTLEQPIRRIAANAGKDPEKIISRILSMSINGWDAKKDEFKNLIDAGIVDPVKVTRKAVENAVSMATMFITCESLLVELPEEKKEKPFNK